MKFVPKKETLRRVGAYLSHKHVLEPVEIDLSIDTPFAEFEHAVHEFSHGVLLGLPPESWCSTEIAEALLPMPEIAKVWNEALAWGLEIRVLRHFALMRGRPFTVKGCLSEAAGLGVPTPLFNQARLCRHLGSPSLIVIRYITNQIQEMKTDELAGRWKPWFEKK
jgi:hypothetical protein